MQHQAGLPKAAELVLTTPAVDQGQGTADRASTAGPAATACSPARPAARLGSASKAASTSKTSANNAGKSSCEALIFNAPPPHRDCQSGAGHVVRAAGSPDLQSQVHPEPKQRQEIGSGLGCGARWPPHARRWADGAG